MFTKTCNHIILQTSYISPMITVLMLVVDCDIMHISNRNNNVCVGRCSL